MKLRCLVLDHDDTVVDSTATVHYPCFVEYVNRYYPHVKMTLEEYFEYNFDPGIVRLFTEIVGMPYEELSREEAYWNEYVQRHIPTAYPGIGGIMEQFRKNGGLLCVVSHSYRANIMRDYRSNDLPEPDMIFGWDDPPEKRKPSVWPLEQIMKTYSLSPAELLVVDDLKPGYDMAKAAGVPFAAAGWANDVPMIREFMKRNSDVYLKAVSDLEKFLFG